MGSTDPLVAAGGVPWRRCDGILQVAVVHRPRYDDWSFPKGKLLAGEPGLLGAVREVREETGLESALGRRMPPVSYPTQGGRKTVDYWTVAATGRFRANDEADAMDWLTPEQARDRLSYTDDVVLLDDLLAAPVAPVRVLLVRHARAGVRHEWDGPDDLRPLDDLGRREAELLAATLPAFRPHRVLSADPLRCRQTVAPLAGGMGVSVESAPDFGEVGYDPAAARDNLRRLLADDVVSVLASQGGVIADLLTWLLESAPRVSGLPPGRTLGLPPARKGSVWALSAVGGAVVAADYYPSFLP